MISLISDFLFSYYGTIVSSYQSSGRSGIIWQSDVDCLGDEDSLLDCPSRGSITNYNHYYDVALSCQPGVYYPRSHPSLFAILLFIHLPCILMPRSHRHRTLKSTLSLNVLSLISAQNKQTVKEEEEEEEKKARFFDLAKQNSVQIFDVNAFVQAMN